MGSTRICRIQFVWNEKSDGEFGGFIFLVVVLDDSEVDKDILEWIVDRFVMLKKPLRKVVFVGLDLKMKNYIKKKKADISFMMTCIDDLEKAKEWLIS
jgi:hypothetical protein